jgi:adhesin transport system outer membrane protein
VQASNARIQAAMADLSAARAQRWPSVIAGLGGQRLADGSTDVALDMSLNYSLDTAGQRRAAIEVAQANLASLTLEKDALEREIRRALDFVRSDQAAGRARIAAARAAVQANARTVAAAGEEFTIGRRSLLDLLDAQRDFVLAQQTLIEAEEQLLLSGYAALALTGDILPAFGVALQDGL